MYDIVSSPDQNVAQTRGIGNTYISQRYGKTDSLKAFLNSATTEFLENQSGNARPFYYLEAILSGQTSVLGVSYTSTNWLMDAGTIDREKPAFPGDKSKLISADVTIKVDDSTRYFSPEVTGSVFNTNKYFEAPFNFYAGFINTSGTCLMVKRSAFLLEQLKIDTRKNITSLRLRDYFKKALRTEIGRDVSGTANPLVYTGSWRTSDVMENLLIDHAGLTANDLDIQTSFADVKDLSLEEMTVAEAVVDLAEASDGFVYTSRNGKVKFVSYVPVWGTSTTANFEVREERNYENAKWGQDVDDVLSKVTVIFSSGSESASLVIQSTEQTANSKKIENEMIQSTADAVAIASRWLGRFSGQTTTIEMPACWMPSIDLGDTIDVWNFVAGETGTTFQVYRIREEVTKGKMRIEYVTDRSEPGKWMNACFFSDASATQCGTVFTGGTLTSGTAWEGDGWQAEWGFFGRDEVTATNPGFDADGDGDHTIDSGYAASGAGSTGIEVPCQFY